MEWFYLALLSAISLALADAFTKRDFQKSTGQEMLLVRFFVPGVLLFPIALLGDYPAINSDFWIWIALLIPLELVAMLLYSLAIRDCALYLTLPYLAFTPVFNVLTANLVLGESITAQKLLGILLVVIGAYFLNVNKETLGGSRNILLPLKAIFTQRGARLMLMAAIVYSVTSVLGKGALQYGVEPGIFGAFYFSVIGAVSLILILLTKPASIQVVIKKPGKSLLVGFFMSAMVVSHFLSLATIEVAYMIAVKRTSLLFGIVLGAFMFSEKNLSQHFFAGSLMVIGVGIIFI